MINTRLKILPPWTIAVREYEALFDGDPQIAFNTNFSGEHPTVVMACNNGDKVAALQQILPDSINFGNVDLKIVIVGTPSNRTFKSKKELFDTAFFGNPAYAYSVCPEEEGYMWFAKTYVVFKSCVVQVFADNLNDCHGVISTLYQFIANDLLDGPGIENVAFNTDIEIGKLGKSVDEWL